MGDTFSILSMTLTQRRIHLFIILVTSIIVGVFFYYIIKNRPNDFYINTRNNIPKELLATYNRVLFSQTINTDSNTITISIIKEHNSPSSKLKEHKKFLKLVLNKNYSKPDLLLYLSDVSLESNLLENINSITDTQKGKKYCLGSISNEGEFLFLLPKEILKPLNKKDTKTTNIYFLTFYSQTLNKVIDIAKLIMKLNKKRKQFINYKLFYDLTYIILMCTYTWLYIYWGQSFHPLYSYEVLQAKALGSVSFFALSYILSIGPLTRLFPGLLKIISVRRHFGVLLFFTAIAHIYFAIQPLLKRFTNQQIIDFFLQDAIYTNIFQFSFEFFGLIAILFLLSWHLLVMNFLFIY